MMFRKNQVFIVLPADGTSPTGDPDAARAYFDRTAAQAHQGDWAGAMDNCDLAIQAWPGLPEPYLLRGIIRRELGQLRDAIADFDKLIELNPTDPAGRIGRATVRCEIGDWTGAEADCEVVITHAPPSVDLADAFVIRGALRNRLKDRNAAIVLYDKALEIDSENASAHVLRGLARYHALEAREKIHADIRRAFELDPALSSSHIAKSIVASVGQDPSAALSECEERLDRDPEDEMALAWKGLILLALGKDAEARFWLDLFGTRSDPPDITHLQRVMNDVEHRRGRLAGKLKRITRRNVDAQRLFDAAIDDLDR